MRLNMRRSDDRSIGKFHSRDGTILSAGYDLFTPVGKTIEPGEQVLINLGIVWDPEPWRLDFPTNTLVLSEGYLPRCLTGVA
jgi:hypothetical protein